MMFFLMDYLPAIQFAAALNIGYIIPDILKKMYNMFENINASYITIIEEVRNKVVVKSKEIENIRTIETKDNHSTQYAIDQLSKQLDGIKKECDETESFVKRRINDYINCSGYRSVFFYSALYSITSLLIIPFCYQHDVWAIKWFYYVFSIISFVYILVLFIKVIVKKSDISCRHIIWMYFLLMIAAIIAAIINEILPEAINIGQLTEELFSWCSIIVSFVPGIVCTVFLTLLIAYSNMIARRYANNASKQFIKINNIVTKLDDFKKFLDEDVTLF